MRNFLIIVFSFLSQSVWAAEILSAQASARRYPFSGHIEFQYRFENLLWEKNKEILYGFWAPRVSLASSGTAEFGVSLYPISIWEISAVESVTSRFYKINKFECDIQTCGGVVHRRKLGTRIVLGKKFDFGTVFAIPSSQFVEMSHSDKSRPLADEAEMNLAQAGGENVIIEQLFLGVKNETGTFGALARKSRYSRSDRMSEMQYLIYRTQVKDIGYSAGIGTFKSYIFPSEASVIFQMSWQSTDSMGLF